MKLIQPDIIYVVTPGANEVADRDELIETQREVIADLQAQLEAIKAHQAEVRKTTNRNYVTAILRANKFEREAAKWKAIATGAIEDCGE